ncbi:MAG: UDP-N-acetylglucosamine 2-epimerase (non-hydrolyzing) [Bacteroidetes bacterium]|nr:MAG: UDP-N-acetylglucosamine 2-epimerase (non-hydrolyzing) [Bacteroidota bacterium]
MTKVLYIFGTRPEAIKMAPLILRMKRSTSFEVKVCVTGQHRTMLDQVLKFFNINPDYDLSLMKTNQTLSGITSDSIKGISRILSSQYDPDLIIVQGDTTTALAGALSGFYFKKKIVHIEAGLRSHNKYSPFPEEMNRVLITKLADLHFAPTRQAYDNLLREGVEPHSVFNVGNTVIDALFLGLKTLRTTDQADIRNKFPFLSNGARAILVTGHRRENFGAPFENICYALKEIVEKNEAVHIIYPVHLNPHVMEPVKRILGNSERIHLTEPLDYPYLIWLLNRSYLIVTDSGGIQEEAPALGKPVIVMRDVTERMEGVAAGTSVLVGTNREKIFSKCQQLLTDQSEYQRMAKSVNPYGDGNSCRRITAILQTKYRTKDVVQI